MQQFNCIVVDELFSDLVETLHTGNVEKCIVVTWRFASVELLHSVVSNVTSIRVSLENNRYIDKMIVLNEFKLLQKIIGFNPLGGIENIFLQVIYWVAFLSSSWMMCTFFILNVRDDIFGALGMFPAFLAYVSHIVTLSHLLTSRDRFYSLLDDLQEIVNESTKIKMISSNTFQ